MQINVVTVRSGWILQKIAERIVNAGNEANLGHFALSHVPKIGADVNFYCDVQNCYRGKTSFLDIGLFTHVHANDISTVNPITYTLDYIFHMAERYVEMFDKYKFYPRAKMSTMVPYEAPINWKVKKPRIGIFQRGKYEGKGYHFMMDFAEQPVCKLFKWVFVGNDWGAVAGKFADNGCSVVNLGDSKLNYPDDYHNWYRQMDHVLIPSKWEGGPISCLEAMTLGIPVIAADVGWCREMGAEIFSNKLHLAAILSRIGLFERNKSKKAARFSYRRCASQIVEVADKL